MYLCSVWKIEIQNAKEAIWHNLGNDNDIVTGMLAGWFGVLVMIVAQYSLFSYTCRPTLRLNQPELEHMVYFPDLDCFLCCVFSVVYCFVTLYCNVLLFVFCVLYCALFLYCTVFCLWCICCLLLIVYNICKHCHRV
jgi:hypothetical protein